MNKLICFLIFLIRLKINLIKLVWCVKVTASSKSVCEWIKQSSPWWQLKGDYISISFLRLLPHSLLTSVMYIILFKKAHIWFDIRCCKFWFWRGNPLMTSSLMVQSKLADAVSAACRAYQGKSNQFRQFMRFDNI